MRKIRAFTIIEVLVAMLLSSFVVISAYIAYLSLIQQFQSSKKNSSVFYEISTINNLIERDFFESQLAVRDNNFLKVFSTNGDSVEYTFNDPEIIRTHNSVSDTFHIKVIEKSFFKNGNTARILDTVDTFSIKLCKSGYQKFVNLCFSKI